MKILIGIYAIVCLLIIGLAFQANWKAGITTIILIVVFGTVWGYFVGKEIWDD